MDGVVGRPEVLGVIQARGGSKGMPGKNLLALGDFPLIAYSVASGLAAKRITRLIISTDSPEIADMAKSYGAEVPFMRPAALATDDAKDFPLFDHALRTLAERESYRPEAVVQLRPTTPLRPRGLLDEAIDLLLADPATDCVRGVTEPSENPFKMWRIPAGSSYMAPLLQGEFPEPYNTPRQKLPPVYWQTGHVDVIRPRTILELGSMTGQRIRPVMIDQRYCIDIDTPRDLELASWRLGRGDLETDLPKRP
jgi:CMP-N-acetylneuraminic acid synthetase